MIGCAGVEACFGVVQKGKDIFFLHVAGIKTWRRSPQATQSMYVPCSVHSTRFHLQVLACDP